MLMKMLLNHIFDYVNFQISFMWKIVFEEQGWAFLGIACIKALINRLFKKMHA